MTLQGNFSKRFGESAQSSIDRPSQWNHHSKHHDRSTLSSRTSEPRTAGDLKSPNGMESRFRPTGLDAQYVPPGGARKAVTGLSVVGARFQTAPGSVRFPSGV
jgi:hypothetical protein